MNSQGHPSIFGLLNITSTPKQTLNSQEHPSIFGLLNIILTLTKYWIRKGIPQILAFEHHLDTPKILNSQWHPSSFPLNIF